MHPLIELLQRAERKHSYNMICMMPKVAVTADRLVY